MYKVKFTKRAIKDSVLIEQAKLKSKATELIHIVSHDTYQTPPEYEALKGSRKGAYSRRINRQHRFIYEVLPNTDLLKNDMGEPYKGIVKVIRMWTHYE